MLRYVAIIATIALASWSLQHSGQGTTRVVLSQRHLHAPFLKVVSRIVVLGIIKVATSTSATNTTPTNLSATTNECWLVLGVCGSSAGGEDLIWRLAPCLSPPQTGADPLSLSLSLVSFKLCQLVDGQPLGQMASPCEAAFILFPVDPQ